MRDWIAHDYDGLDFDCLYYAVTLEVPEVSAVLQPYVGTTGAGAAYREGFF